MARAKEVDELGADVPEECVVDDGFNAFASACASASRPFEEDSDADGSTILVGVAASSVDDWPTSSAVAPAEPPAPVAAAAPPTVVSATSASSASTMPPAAPAAKVGLDAGATEDAIVHYFMPDGNGGKIVWYKSKKCFMAYCGCPEKHGKLCRVTRSALPPKTWTSSPSQGRCAGFLAAWILFGDTVPDAEIHKNSFRPSRLQRRAGRALLASSEQGRRRLAKERLKEHPESDSEPELCP